MRLLDQLSKKILQLSIILTLVLTIIALTPAATAKCSDTSLDIRIHSYSKRVFDGETFRAEIEVLNPCNEMVSGVKLSGGIAGDYSVGFMMPNGTKSVQIRVPPEDYEIGTNEIDLQASHSEGGRSTTKTIKFRVLCENEAVEVFLAKTNSPIYEGETLEFSLVVYGAAHSEARDLRVKALSEKVTPEGYGVGEEMKIETEEDMDKEDLKSILGDYLDLGDVGDYLDLGDEANQNEKDRAVIGKKLYFEAEDLTSDDNSLPFEVKYDLGNRSVTRIFEVDFDIKKNPSLKLIQKDSLKAKRGETAIISLEIANEMSTEVEAVRVIPPENYPIMPSSRFVGSMDPNDYLPLDFRIQTENLEDGENLSFFAVYRIGETRIYKSDPITVRLNLEEKEKSIPSYYIGIAAISVVIIALIFYYWRWR